MALMDLEREVAELKRRVDLHDTLLAQHTGQFEFITGQLREVQRFMHTKFAEVDRRFDVLEGRFDALEGKFDVLVGRFDRLEEKVDALPRIIAEMIAKPGS